MKKKFICLVLLLSCLILSPLLYSNVKADPDWLTGWGYRKSHNITGASGAGANYQMGFKAYYGSGTDGNETIGGTVFGKVYLNSKCEADFGDVRFTDDDGSTELDYWMQEKIDSDYAIFWVEVADDLGSNQTIYVYYGKSGESTTSNIYNTFIFGDDFDDGDISDWDTIDASLDGSIYVSSPYGLKLDGLSSIAHAYHDIASQSGKFVITLHFRSLYGSGNKFSYYTLRDSAPTPGTNLDFLQGSNLKYYDGSWHTINEVTAETWYKLKLVVDVVADEFDAWVDDVLKTSAGNFRNALAEIVEIGLDMHYASGRDNVVWIDALRVRKYVDPEPMHGAWGEEEEEEMPLFYVDFYYTAGGVLRVDNVTIANGTQTGFENETVIELVSLPENSTYIFSYFSWDGSNSTTNPHNLTITSNLTLWCYFEGAAERGEYIALGLAVSLILIPLLILIVWAVKRRR